MSSERRTPKGAGRSPVHQLVAELEVQYRAKKKEWKLPSPAFVDRRDRFDKIVPGSPNPYSPRNGMLETDAEKARKIPSPWSLNKSKQRPDEPQPTCTGDYSPRPVSANGSAALSAFASRSPKYEESVQTSITSYVPTTTGASEGSKRATHPTSTMVSKTPRFTDAKVWTTAVYDVTSHGSIERESKAACKSPSPWTKTKAPQRPSPETKTDAFYDIKLDEMTASARASFRSVSPRFAEDRNDVPPVGHYTSPVISCGMMY